MIKQSFSAMTTLFVVCLTLVNMTCALPLEQEELQKRTNYEITGYRYVNPTVAQRYNNAGTLTNERANGVQIGQGAYISPGPNQWPVSANYWLCVIWADANAWRQIPKLWIPARDHHYSNRRLFWEAGEANRNAYIRQARLDPASTILFSHVDFGSHPPLDQHGQPLVLSQMLIPPGYLWGNGPFGHGTALRAPSIRASCHPPNYAHPTAQAGWGGWSIPGFGY